ncbi:phosphopentomutase [Variovorax robiniae]|uniref:Phosphopentomutase n=1 Tax=Variovorax robiniae TaxID=1836199 RepID=A0ABU8WZJ8_9BURK
MTRSFILVLDSLGVGAAPDAAAFGDSGANTLGSIAGWRAAQGQPLRIPHLESLGLAAASHAASGTWPAACAQRDGFTGAWAAAAERSRGKDTPSGHWEMSGVPVDFDWGLFPAPDPCFPPELIRAWTEACGLDGILGDCHASGTEIIARLGDEHVATGRPIVYTSGDSVFQVAAHETHFGLERLNKICKVAFELLQPYRIARVIARPFTGANGEYKRTANRKDIAVPPPGETLLDVASRAGREVIALGKIGDIFAMRGVTQLHKAPDNMGMFDHLMTQVDAAPEGALVFANFVDFDQNYGHRRDLAGYAQALEEFDARLPAFMARLRPGDLCAFTADHGCDPTFPGSDHTREYVPQLFAGPGVKSQSLGLRESFCDLGQTVAHHLGLPALAHGTPLSLSA